MRGYVSTSKELLLIKAASGIQVGGDNASETMSRQGFQETSVGSPGSQFLYEKDAPLEAKTDEDVSERQTDRKKRKQAGSRLTTISFFQTESVVKEPIRSISSYFAGLDPEESPTEPRNVDFDFLGHASIR